MTVPPPAEVLTETPIETVTRHPRTGFTPALPLAGRAPHDRDRCPDLVLLPGMLGTGEVWDPVAERLMDQATIRVARIDLDRTVPDLAAGVLAEAPARFALAGHSLGAIVALEVIRQAPERVSRLALLNSSGQAPTPAQRETWAGWRQRVASGEFDSVVRELASVTLPAGKRADSGLTSLGERMGRSVGPAGFARQLAAQRSRTDLRPGLGEITAPTLVISGDQDEICSPARQRELADGIPGAGLETLAGVGHMSPIEAPDALAAALLTWLRAR